MRRAPAALRAAGAAVGVATELAFRHVRSEDVEAATEFATRLFLGGIGRIGRQSWRRPRGKCALGLGSTFLSPDS